MHLGPLELGIILVIIILLFGVGRIGKIAGEMGSGVRAFREGLKGPEKEEEKKAEEESSTDEKKS
jgi:sec-independent protein translocase protein TatA